MSRLERVAVTITVMLSVSDAEYSSAQSAEGDVREENLLESVLTNSDDVADILTPIDINRATTEDLLSITGVDEGSAASIIAYRKRNGSIRSFDDLWRVDGMTSELFSALLRHIRVPEDNNFHGEGMSYFSLSPQRAPLFKDAYGDYGISNFQRFSLSYRNLEAYAVTDKDPGEGGYADFYSMALTARRVWLFSAISIGDYALSLGNGLLFSSGGMVSKSAGAISPLFAARAYSLKPYRSRGENKFLRGGALSLDAGAFGITAFVSSKKLAARFDSTGLITSIDYSGLHLPTSRPGSRNNLAERIAGGIIHYDAEALTAGVSAVYFHYDRAFRHCYEKEVLALESFGRLRADSFAFSGELLLDKLVSFASNISLDYGDARFAVGVRDLRSRIVQNYSGPLSESFPTNPEQGIYFGATVRPVDIVKLGFYYDRFRIFSASGEPERSGEEIFVDSYVSFSREKLFEGSGTIIYLRYRYKTKEDSYVPSADFPVALSVIAGSKQSFRIDFRHRFNPVFSFRARTERIFLSSGEKGEMILFDSGWRFGGTSLDSRICFYRTDSYASAFYTVEKNLPHVMDFTFLYGDGARLFLLGNWEATRSLTVGIKMSRDIYNRTREVSVGSGSKYVPGLTELSLELCYTINRGR